MSEPRWPKDCDHCDHLNIFDQMEGGTVIKKYEMCDHGQNVTNEISKCPLEDKTWE